MSASAKRGLAIGLAVLLIVGIVFAIFGGRLFGASTTAGTRPLTVVTGVIGSEKAPFFADAGVKKIFASHGYDVEVTTAGSRQIATSVNLKGVDFVFPSSAPAAQKIKLETGASTTFAPFYSPMAIATFTPIVQLLSAAGIATQDSDGTWHLDMAKYLQAVAAGTRWNQLPGAASVYNSSRSILISSTDIRQSNSAAMYLAIASYVANNDSVVDSQADEDALIDQMGSLFLEQGFSASSSEEPFDDYLAQGIGSKPMVMIYEAQFLGEEMSAQKSAITPDMVLMYPDPTVFSKHTVVPLTKAGTAIGQLLVDDPKLAKLEAIYGFRPANPSVFNDALTEHKLAVPPLPVNVIDPPSYETLESMIEQISTRYDSPGTTATPSPVTTTDPSPTPTPPQ
jgi:hypothetical protein